MSAGATGIRPGPFHATRHTSISVALVRGANLKWLTEYYGTPTPTPTGACVGDCSHHSTVTVDEIILMVNIALGNASISACPGFAQWCNQGDLGVVISCLIEAVNNALYGCG